MMRNNFTDIFQEETGCSEIFRWANSLRVLRRRILKIRILKMKTTDVKLLKYQYCVLIPEKLFQSKQKFLKSKI